MNNHRSVFFLSFGVSNRDMELDISSMGCICALENGVVSLGLLNILIFVLSAVRVAVILATPGVVCEVLKVFWCAYSQSTSLHAIAL